MNAHLRARERSEGGFTLIELLVVMIIIAILMAVAVPTFLAQKNNAQKSKATSNIKQIVNAIETCSVNNTDGTYTGCTTAATIKASEQALNSLTINDGTSPPLGGYAIQPSGAQGYIVSAQIQDGPGTVYFAEAHLPTGALLKNCGGSGIVPMTTKNATGIPTSKTCKTGTWG